MRTFFFNGIEDRSFSLDNSKTGQTSLSRIIRDPYPKRYQLSYEGVQQCVQYNTYEGENTVQKIFCAINGPICVLEEAAACTSRNCFGDTAPNDNL